ncbi:MAG TPA: hypothetical protein VLG44_05240 [Chlamydiales bacterium]|nr:hypothetical protein [Chlamydiales bacterium]
MLVRSTILYSLLLVFLSGVIAYQLIHVRDVDYKAYQELEMQKAAAIEKKSLWKPLKQMRQIVQKDIYLPEENERHHLRITSENSELSFRFINKKPQIVENLKQLQCWMQDKILNDSQQIRYFTAKEGTYLFPSHFFYAQKVHLSFYQCPGFLLPTSLSVEDAFLNGFANEVSFQLNEKSPTFTAHKLKAKIYPEKSPL